MFRPVSTVALLALVSACGPKKNEAQPILAELPESALAPSAGVEPYTTGPVEAFIGDLQVHTFTYPNGLVLKVVPDDAAPVVAYQTWMGVGSADEALGKTGLAHLFEHMMFKGTDGYADGEFDKQLDLLGAEGMNAWTWLDQTVYIESVPKSALDKLVPIEATRFDGLVVEQAPFESEIEVVTNERRLRVDNDPEGKMGEMLFARAFEKHTYGWPTVGWLADLENLKVEDAQAFYKRWYAPDNATIVVVGDVVPAAVADLVLTHYGPMKPSGVEATEQAPEPEQTAQRRVEEELPIASDRLSVAYKVPEYTHADIPAVLVLDAALTAPLTGRLRRMLVDGGYATELSAFVMPLKYPSVYQIDVTARPGVSAEQLEQALDAELAKIRAEGISQGELEAGIAQWEKSTWNALEDAAGKADFLGWSLVHTGDHKDGVRRIEAIKKVTLEDVKRVAGAYFVPARSTVAVGRASEPAEAVTVEAPALAPAAVIAVEARELAGTPELPPGQLVERQVEGATVLLSYDDTLPLVNYRVHFPSGAAVDPAGKEGLASLAGEMLLRGSKTWSRKSFEEAFEQLGASVSVSVDADGLTVSGDALASRWPAVWELLRSALTEPAFDEAELASLKGEVIAALDARKDDDRELVNAAYRRAVYGPQHPYGRDPRGAKASVEAITAADLADFHARQLRAAGAVVGLAGAFDAGTEADVAALLGALKGSPAATAVFPAPPALEGRTVVLVDKPERTQAQVRIGQVGLQPRDDDFAAFLLFNDGFGTGFGGRLMKEVRVARGWSYYAYSFPDLHGTGADWSMSLAPGTEYATDAIELVLDLAGKADASGLTEDEFVQSQQSRIAKRPFLIDTAPERLDLEIRKRTLGYDRLAATDRMATLTLGEVNSAFAEAIDPSRLVIAVVATADVTKAKLEEKLGPVQVVSYTDL